MADLPSGYTTNYNLAKWDDGDTPGATALNNNLDAIDTGIKEALDAASGTPLTQIKYLVRGVAGGASLDVTELSNNVAGGAALDGKVTPVSGIGDFTFKYTTDFLAGKKVFMTPITIFELGLPAEEATQILGYAFFDHSEDNAIVVRTVDAAFADASNVITETNYLIFEFTIVDA